MSRAILLDPARDPELAGRLSSLQCLDGKLARLA